MPTALMTDTNRTPFNIGRSIQLVGFKQQEAMSLMSGLTGVVTQPEAVLTQILQWTGGQPFLTQKLCQLVRMACQQEGGRGRGDKEMPGQADAQNVPLSLCASSPCLVPGDESLWVEQLVRTHIIKNWEAQDEPEHLKTIRARLCRSPLSNRLFNSEPRTGRLLRLYQQVLQNKEVFADNSSEQVELLLSGLLIKSDGLLKVHNRIYQAVFSLDWVEQQLEKIRLHHSSVILRRRRIKIRLLEG